MMNNRKLVVRLKGGLGNQMFQYAAGRGLALRNGMKLMLDTQSGFVRDRVYRRTFSLDGFPIHAETVGALGQLPFWFEQGKRRYGLASSHAIENRPWGIFLYESENRFLHEIAEVPLPRNTWMEGYWQSEEYFAGYADLIAGEFALPEPAEPNFMAMGETIMSCNAVAVGVRLFEEVPGQDKSGVGGVTPLLFYEEAANLVARHVSNPTFFVFSTQGAPVWKKMNLPGPTYYITHDDGFRGALPRLWLISRCRHHILSNSCFYYWGAWLSERENPGNVIIACDLFPNKDTIPPRWMRYNIGTRLPTDVFSK
jgi:hypothetical protein